ncbi:hypothetical protein ACHAXR_003336 [Thalassiosira sp. AJA248-18]
MVLPLKEEPNMEIDISTIKSPHHEFQSFMLTSDYCLVTCGTLQHQGGLPTPCQWAASQSSSAHGFLENVKHLVTVGGAGPALTVCITFLTMVKSHGKSSLLLTKHCSGQKVFLNYTTEKKRELRSIMQKLQFSFIYGWGSPLTTQNFGRATDALWTSILDRVFGQE